MKESLMMIYKMDLELLNLLTVIIMRGNLNKIKNTEKAIIDGLMETIIMVNLRTI